MRVIARALRNTWDDLFTLCVINVITLALQLTIVLGPPALAAMHFVCHRVSEGNAIKLETYFSALKTHFGVGWRVCAPVVIVAALMIYNLRFYGTFAAQWAAFVQGLWLAGLVFVAAVQFYLLPFWMAQEDKRVRVTLRNSALVAAANPLYTLTLLVASVGLTVLFLAVTPLFVLFGLTVWTMFGNAAVADRVAYARDRASQLSEKADTHAQRPKR
jgi:uncharacterized membrane protein YesL